MHRDCHLLFYWFLPCPPNIRSSSTVAVKVGFHYYPYWRQSHIAPCITGPFTAQAIDAILSWEYVLRNIPWGLLFLLGTFLLPDIWNTRITRIEQGGYTRFVENDGLWWFMVCLSTFGNQLQFISHVVTVNHYYLHLLPKFHGYPPLVYLQVVALPWPWPAGKLVWT